MTKQYISKGQQRLTMVLLALEGREVEGVSPKEVAAGLQIPPSAVTIALANLAEAGLAERMPQTNRWRLTPRVIQIGMSMMRGVEQAKARVAEVEQRYTRLAD